MSEKYYSLTNPCAQDCANNLYRFLFSMHGKGILSGQQECPCDRTNGDELAHIFACSGQLPAILGLDYIENDFNGVNKRAKDWHGRGGIVSICWHWGIPPFGLGYTSSQESVDMTELLTPGTPLYQGLLDNLDAVAAALSELCEAGIPVLWRPLHEFDGAWFWWGKGGAGPFKELWRLMYERYTKLHKLNNLIWVLGYSHEMHEDWYPGDSFVDCIGADAYTDAIHKDLYEKVKKVTEKPMPVCHHENGPIPDPGKLAAEGVLWDWFLTWHTVHIHEQNSAEYIKYVYNHPYVITLSKLRDIYKN